MVVQSGVPTALNEEHVVSCCQISVLLKNFKQPLNISLNPPAAGCKPLVYLSFIIHNLYVLPFTCPMYLFPFMYTPITVLKHTGK